MAEHKNKRPLVIIAGPTASGKTELSIALAKQIGGEIISADSMQVYKYMDIGTAKVSKEEMQGIRHYLVDELEPSAEFNIVLFQQRAKAAMAEIAGRDRIPMLVGGTGFYIQSVLYDVDFREDEAELKEDGGGFSTETCGTAAEAVSYRQSLEQLADAGEYDRLHKMLGEVDTQSAQTIHPHNVKRVIRALEYYHETGKKISEHNARQRAKKPPYNSVFFVLCDERAKLYERIDRRVDSMFEKGLVKEVQQLKDMGYDRSFVSMQGIGYKEVLDYLDGETSLEEAKYIIKRDTRHFAKRQLTWFKREQDICWLDWRTFDYDRERMLAHMLSVLAEKQIGEREND